MTAIIWNCFMSNTDASLYKPHLPVLVAQNWITLKYYKFQGHYLGPKSDIYLKGRFAHSFFCYENTHDVLEEPSRDTFIFFIFQTQLQNMLCAAVLQTCLFSSVWFSALTQRREIEQVRFLLWMQQHQYYSCQQKVQRQIESDKSSASCSVYSLTNIHHC